MIFFSEFLDILKYVFLGSVYIYELNGISALLRASFVGRNFKLVVTKNNSNNF
jgi:hypothetical protein